MKQLLFFCVAWVLSMRIWFSRGGQFYQNKRYVEFKLEIGVREQALVRISHRRKQDPRVGSNLAVRTADVFAVLFFHCSPVWSFRCDDS